MPLVAERGTADSIAITGHYHVVISMPGCAAEAYTCYPLKIWSHDFMCLFTNYRFHSCGNLCDRYIYETPKI